MKVSSSRRLTGAGCIGVRRVYPMERQAMRFFGLIGDKLPLAWPSRGTFRDFDLSGDFDPLFGAAMQNLKIVDLPIRCREPHLRNRKHPALEAQLATPVDALVHLLAVGGDRDGERPWPPAGALDLLERGLVGRLTP